MSAKRLGKFQMSEKLYNEQWHIIKYLFLEFKPIHIERNFWSRNEHTILFYGESDHFCEIEEMEVTPHYTLILNFKEPGTPVFNFVRNKE